MKTTLPDGAVHKLPEDFKLALSKNPVVTEAWEDITPLARNEWICWVEDAKKQETREKRMRIAQEQLADGKRRPCCWPGCSHRKKNKK